MAQTIKIKRSTGTGKPSSVDQGEIFYAYGTGGTYGKKLSIGNVAGGTNTPEIIGGSYYTAIIDAATNANTASKLVLRDGSGNFSAGTITANLTGNVSGSAGTVTSISAHDTNDLSEGSTNLYFTNARADARITAALIDEDNMVSNSATRLPSQQSVKAYVDGQTTSDLSEGTNLYYTNARADARIAAADTADLTEGTNLYYTDARVSTRADTILNHSNHGNITVSKVGAELRFSAAAQYGDSNVQSYLSGGTGVTLSSSGEFSIGQAVATNSNVTFGTVGCGNITTTGYIRGPSTLTIDPAAHGNDTGTVVIAGDLTVQGTTTTVNSTTVALGDAVIELNSGESGTPSENAGIEVERGTATNVSLLWNETNDNWTVSDGSATSVLLTAANFAATYAGTIDGGTYS
jgi:hypothetical protein|tara:strand:+ start:2760 stop:3977 length:1218 start_codon:yes stop_codon:yes gene_type:complete